MAVFLRSQYARGSVPEEYVKLALSHLESAQELVRNMLAGTWPPNFYRGESVTLLAFHATELFLKAFILKVAPEERVTTHSLRELTDTLKRLAPNLNFDPPFSVTPLVPYPELVRQAQREERRLHEHIRYPTDRDGEPWPGVRGFEPESAGRLLSRIRTDCERIYIALFEGPDGAA